MSGDWWPDDKPAMGDELAADCAALWMDRTDLDSFIADIAIYEACLAVITRYRLHRRLGLPAPIWSAALTLEVAAS